ncbi:hypothetical protein HGM15179_017057, partial [Zosterops borbonicus]
MTPPSQQTRLKQPQGTISLMDTRDPHRGNPSHWPSASPRKETLTTLPVSAPAPSMFQLDAIPTCNLVNFWKE